jgi:hypothetical protein
MCSPGNEVSRHLSTTPIETYELHGRRVLVKRDDLFGRAPMPPLGKLRGLKRILGDHHRVGILLVGCWDTRVSKLGLGVAVACQSWPGMRCLLAYPAHRGDGPPPALADAERFGAELLPLKPNHIDICFAQAGRETVRRGGAMLPFGLECEASVDAIAAEAQSLPAEVTQNGTVVVSCGSGVTMSGLLRGLQDRPSTFVGISSGRSINRIKQCIGRYVQLPNARLQLIEAVTPYSLPANVESPFPAHPHYDLKAWQYLESAINRYPPPILFWNVGA